MEIVAELEMTAQQLGQIEQLRNRSFPDHRVDRSYYKQLPHYRALEYRDRQLVGYLGLDLRMVNVGGQPLKVLGIIDFCIEQAYRGQGLGSAMLAQLTRYAQFRQVDFLVLVADQDGIYRRNGFSPVSTTLSWLKIHEHRNYGIAREPFNDLYVKALSDKAWPTGDVDWLGYLY